MASAETLTKERDPEEETRPKPYCETLTRRRDPNRECVARDETLTRRRDPEEVWLAVVSAWAHSLCSLRTLCLRACFFCLFQTQSYYFSFFFAQSILILFLAFFWYVFIRFGVPGRCILGYFVARSARARVLFGAGRRGRENKTGAVCEKTGVCYIKITEES